MSLPLKEASRKKGRRQVVDAQLDRWAKELASGGGQPNILEKFREVRMPRGNGAKSGAMFGPISERVDRVLRDIAQIDPTIVALLFAVAEGRNKKEISEMFSLSRHAVDALLDEGYGMLEYGIYLADSGKLHSVAARAST